MSLRKLYEHYVVAVTPTLLYKPMRQTLGWKTPEEAMAMELAEAGLANRCT